MEEQAPPPPNKKINKKGRTHNNQLSSIPEDNQGEESSLGEGNVPAAEFFAHQAPEGAVLLATTSVVPFHLWVVEQPPNLQSRRAQRGRRWSGVGVVSPSLRPACRQA